MPRNPSPMTMGAPRKAHRPARLRSSQACPAFDIAMARHRGRSDELIDDATPSGAAPRVNSTLSGGDPVRVSTSRRGLSARHVPPPPEWRRGVHARERTRSLFARYPLAGYIRRRCSHRGYGWLQGDKGRPCTARMRYRRGFRDGRS